MKKLIIWLVLVSSSVSAQYFQQYICCKMVIDFDVKKNEYTGRQALVYQNNSNDTLKKVYFHLYPNAFQPNSEMDFQCQQIKDLDLRVMVNVGSQSKPQYQSKIAGLSEKEQGKLSVSQLTQNGQLLQYHLEDTVLEVDLMQPILPHSQTQLDLDFKGQVPLQIRRSGRVSAEGVALTMAQWYPKIAVYDKEGWHTTPYLGREFYGEWGDYDVTIKIDQKYVLGGTGYLQNATEVGCGYVANAIRKVADGKLTWHFVAPMVHDFTWVADPDFIHQIKKLNNGPELHLFYKNNLSETQRKSWEQLPAMLELYFKFYQEKIGPYPYRQYSVLQGGDGGMEYGMCTVVTGKRESKSLLGVVAHELAHSWFQFLLATNESKYAWMDEGFTTYITAKLEEVILNEKEPFKQVYEGYLKLVNYKIEEPLTTHADAFSYNYGYGISSYNKGALFLRQLEYILGEKVLEQILQQYFKTFKFKHPDAVDFIRCAEKVSGIHLGWYLNYWTQTTATIDYALNKVSDKHLMVQRKGKISMPLEVLVTYEDNSQELFYIPLSIMRGEKNIIATKLADAQWANPNYMLQTSKKIKKAVLDPSQMMADVDLSNNTIENSVLEK